MRVLAAASARAPPSVLFALVGGVGLICLLGYNMSTAVGFIALAGVAAVAGVVMLIGVISSTILTLIVIPAIYALVKQFTLRCERVRVETAGVRESTH